MKTIEDLIAWIVVEYQVEAEKWENDKHRSSALMNKLREMLIKTKQVQANQTINK